MMISDNCSSGSGPNPTNPEGTFPPTPPVAAFGNHAVSSTDDPPAARSALAYSGSIPEFVAASGLYLTDSEGNAYLDAESGTFNIPLGYNHPTVIQAVKNVLDTGLTHVSSSFVNRHVTAAAQSLVEAAPENLTRCHMKGSTGGSEANEQALRACAVATGKRSIAAFRSGHHGQSIATSAVSGMPYRRDRLPASYALPVVHVEAPDCYRCPYGKTPETCNFECIEPIETALDHAPTGTNDAMAFIAEPILGAGGGITPPRYYWESLHKRLAERDIPLVFDEVQTFGRTGFLFAADYYGVQPELITLAKGISGIGVPAAGAVLMEERFAVLNSGERSLTWGASPITTAAIDATLSVMNDSDFLESIRSTGRVLKDRLLRLEAEIECVGTVRGVGLMTGIELVRSKKCRTADVDLANAVAAKAMDAKMLLRTSQYGRGSFIKVRPPLIATPADVEEICDRLEWSIKAVIEDAT